MDIFHNPFRPGAGQKPPYLAGRQQEQTDFYKILKQSPVLQNLIITGLRGVGKTALLETLKPLAIMEGWFWAGTDLSESASISEQNLSTRIITDISSLTSAFTVMDVNNIEIGYAVPSGTTSITGNYFYLKHIYDSTPGLDNDKLKVVLEKVWDIVKSKAKGIVLAYDEAQILKDQASDKQYPLSLLLEVIQYLQRRQIPYLLVLTGLPTLFPNLVETRTYAERMFHIMTIDKLNEEESGEAIKKPVEIEGCPVCFSNEAIIEFFKYSGGYPYFIQFLCKEAFDSYLQQLKFGLEQPVVILSEIVRKLDTDFYSGRWARVTDRQRDLLRIIASLPTAEEEFTVQDIAEKSNEVFNKPFSSSHINQILSKLSDYGLIYKNRHGKYSFAVPMLSGFIKRQTEEINKEQFVAP